MSGWEIRYVDGQHVVFHEDFNGNQRQVFADPDEQVAVQWLSRKFSTRPTPVVGVLTEAKCSYCTEHGHGHRTPGSKPFGVMLSPDRDSDGQPTTLLVSYSAGEHVSEVEVDYVWQALRDADLDPTDSKYELDVHKDEDGYTVWFNNEYEVAQSPDKDEAIRQLEAFLGETQDALWELRELP